MSSDKSLAHPLNLEKEQRVELEKGIKIIL
jgi:hypothetical protein